MKKIKTYKILLKRKELLEKSLNNTMSPEFKVVTQARINEVTYIISELFPVQECKKCKNLFTGFCRECQLNHGMCKCGHHSNFHDFRNEGECRVDIADDPEIQCNCKKFELNKGDTDGHEQID